MPTRHSQYHVDNRKVVSIFCDVFARDAAKKTEELRRENEQLLPIYDEMTKFRLQHNGGEVAVVDISAIDDDVEDDSYYMYRLENLPIISLNESRSFACFLAGAVGVELPFRSPLPKLILQDDENLVMEVTLTKDVVLKATLSGYQGTLQEVKDMVDQHVYQHFFSTLGVVVATTGEPLTPTGMGHRPILGASCHFHTLALRKDAIASALNLNLSSTQPAGEGEMYAEDLPTYSLAFPDHEFMEQASSRYETEWIQNQKLKAAREVYKNVRGVGVDGPLFELNLCDGKKSSMFSGRTQRELGTLVWQMEPSEEQATVLLSSLADFCVTMGGATICDKFASEWGGAFRMISFDGGFVLKYKPVFYVVEAIFVYNDSANQYLEDEVRAERFLDRVHQTITSASSNIIFPDQPLEGMTVRLVFLHIGLDTIRARLHYLGVQVDSGVSE